MRCCTYASTFALLRAYCFTKQAGLNTLQSFAILATSFRVIETKLGFGYHNIRTSVQFSLNAILFGLSMAALILSSKSAHETHVDIGHLDRRSLAIIIIDSILLLIDFMALIFDLVLAAFERKVQKFRYLIALYAWRTWIATFDPYTFEHENDNEDHEFQQL
jgi:dipeptide/tripeptide permease